MLQEVWKQIDNIKTHIFYLYGKSKQYNHVLATIFRASHLKEYMLSDFESLAI